MSVNLKNYFYIHSALGNGELSILHSPNGINFKGNEPVKTSELPKIISTALGHTTQTVFNSLMNYNQTVISKIGKKIIYFIINIFYLIIYF